MNSSPVKGELIIFPLFLLEENAILPMTPKASCEGRPLLDCWFINFQIEIVFNFKEFPESNNYKSQNVIRVKYFHDHFFKVLSSYALLFSSSLFLRAGND